MPLPFLAGLILGGGAILAYNNRREIAKTLQGVSKDFNQKTRVFKDGLSQNARKFKDGVVQDLEISTEAFKEAAQKIKSRRGRKPRNQIIQENVSVAKKPRKPRASKISQTQTPATFVETPKQDL